jgi:hypothetical protein
MTKGGGERSITARGQQVYPTFTKLEQSRKRCTRKRACPPPPCLLLARVRTTNPSPPHATEADCYGRTVLLVYLDAARTVSPGAACLPPPCPPMGACCCCRLSLSLFIWYRTYPLVLSLERAGSEESESFFADSTRDNWELKIRKQVDSTDTCSPSLLYTCRVVPPARAGILKK